MTAALTAVWTAEDTACRGADPRLFFTGPTLREGAPDRVTREQMTATAWTYCSGCPLLARCGEAADDRKETGLWAGSLRRRKYLNAGPYLVDPLIPSAPASRHTPTEEAA